jgi:predicted DNA-binding protein
MAESPKRKVIGGMRFDPETADRISAVAKKTGLSKSVVIRLAVRVGIPKIEAGQFWNEGEDNDG